MSTNLSLIIINQSSGTFKSYRRFCQWIQQYPHQTFMIQECHSMNLPLLLQTHTFSKLILIGGDGTIHLCLQELLAINQTIPIEIIPSGSGNGLWHSLQLPNFSTLQESYRMCKLSLLTIQDTQSLAIKYCMNAISWGFISMVDLSTEWLRKLGSFRFDLGAIWHLLRKQTHQGTLHYTDEQDEIHTVTGNFFNLWICNLPITSKGVFCSPQSMNSESDYFWIHYIQTPVSRCELASIFMNISSPSHLRHPAVHYVKAKHFQLEIQSGQLVIDGEKLISKQISGKKDKQYSFHCSSL